MNPREFGAITQVLLIEPDNLVRGTVSSVCRDMKLLRIIQANSQTHGEQYLQTLPLQGVILSLAEGDSALDLLARLRQRAFACEADTPVVVMATTCTKEQAVRLKALEVRRLLLQPFRMRDVIHTLEQIWPAAQAAAAPRASSESAVS